MGRTGIATVHDSGLERAHVADVADELGVPFAAISPATTARLAALLDPGLEAANPLDVWGTGSRAEEQLSGSLAALADDPAVQAVALAVDLVHEFDGDESYPLAVTETARRTSKPVVVLSNVPAAIDPDTAAGLRAAGIPVLEGTRSGLLALKHLLDHAADPGPPAPPPVPDQARQQRWTRAITAGEAHGARLEDLLRDYGITAARTQAADSTAGALAAAAALGYPVVLKTDEPGIAHKSDAGGVVLGIGDPDALRVAYHDVAGRLGSRVLICETIPAGPELSLGLARDHELGPLLVVGAGGVLVELLADRAVALPPVSAGQAHRMLGTLRVARLLAGVRGQPPADLDSVAAAITGLSQLAAELGDVLEALDINPLICGPDRAVAVDTLLIPRSAAGAPMITVNFCHMAPFSDRDHGSLTRPGPLTGLALTGLALTGLAGWGLPAVAQPGPGYAADRATGVDDLLEGPGWLRLRAAPLGVAPEHGPDPAGVGPPAADVPVSTGPVGQPVRAVLDRHQPARPAIELTHGTGPVMNGPECPARKSDPAGMNVDGATRGEYAPADGTGPGRRRRGGHKLEVLGHAAGAGASSGDAAARHDRGERERAGCRAQGSAHNAPCQIMRLICGGR